MGSGHPDLSAVYDVTWVSLAVLKACNYIAAMAAVYQRSSGPTAPTASVGSLQVACILHGSRRKLVPERVVFIVLLSELHMWYARIFTLFRG